MSIRYLDLSGAVNFWTNIKNYILSKIPTKTSELTNDSGFLTQHQSLSNYVTLNSEQTITGKKLFTNSTTKVNSVNTFTGSTQFIDLSTTVPRGEFPESTHRVGRVYIGDNTSYNGSWFIIDPTIDTDKAYYRMVTTSPDNTDSTRFSITWDSTKEGARRRRLACMGDLICATNNTYQIGESGNVWKDAYINKIHGISDYTNFLVKVLNYTTTLTHAVSGRRTVVCEGAITLTVPAPEEGSWFHIKATTERVVLNFANGVSVSGVDGIPITLKPNESILLCYYTVSSYVAFCNFKRCGVIGRTGTAPSEPKNWFKVAECTLTETFTDPFICLKVFESTTGNTIGTLCAHCRINNTIGVVDTSNCYLQWQDAGAGIDLSKYALTTNETSGTGVTITIWCTLVGGYSSLKFEVVTECKRNDYPNNNTWKITRDRQADGDLAELSDTDFTKIVYSTLTTLKNDTTGKASNVTGTVAIANGGTGATSRLSAIKNLTNESVGTPTYFLGLTTNYAKCGYTSITQAKTVLGITGDMGSHSDSEYVHKTGDESITGTKTFGNGTLIVDNGTGNNVHGEIKLNGTRPVYINADNSEDGLFANTACGMSIILNDSSKSIHIGGYTTNSSGRKIIKTADKAPYLSLGTQEVVTKVLVPENDTADSTFSITPTLNYASGASAKSFTVKFRQSDDGSSGVFPVANNKTDLGLSGNRWKNVYATNYYYGSDAVEFSTKFVTSDTTQTISGAKTFSSTITGNISGNASTATEFSANKDVTLTGDVTGTASSKAGWSVSTTLSNSGVTAGTYGPSEDVTGNNNATISVPEITVDSKGRVTSVTNRTLTCKNNTYNVYNKTLTIQKNGTNVATFTSNSNTNVTANITVPTKTSELTNDSNFLTTSSSLNASKLTGTIDIARLPQGALERVITVADQTARFALTTSSVQLGDTVKQLDTGVMYVVVNESKLNSNDGYLEYTAGSASSVPWSGITSKPTEFTPSSHTHTKSEITDFPTNVSAFTNDSGYLTSHQSLSNYVTLDGTQTIAGTKTFSSTISGSISGNAGTATQFSANTTVALTGDATGTSAGSKKGWSVPVTLANSGVTAGTYGPSADVTGSNNATILVPQITVDAKGRVTAVTNRTYTSVNTDTNTDTKVTQTVTNDNACYPLLIANTASASHTGLEPTTETDEVRKAYNINVQARYGFIYARNSYNHDNLKGSVAGGNRTSAGFYGSTYDGATVGGVELGRVDKYGNRYSRLYATNHITDGALAPDGTAVASTFDVGVLADGTKYLNTSAGWYCNVYPTLDNTRTLGTSSLRWKECYSNAYYLGTTAFGDIVTHNASEFLTSHQSLSSCVKNVVTNNQTIKSTGITRGTAPSSAQTFGIAFTDNNNKYIGNIYGQYATDKSTYVGLYAYKGTTTSNGDNAYVRVGYDASGNVYTSAPTPAITDNSTQIATTAFVKAQGYLTSHQSLANYVTTNTDQSISGIKSHSKHISILGDYIGNEFSTNARTCLYLKANRDTDGQSGIYFSKFRQNVAQGALTGSNLVSLTLDVLENSVRTNNCISIDFRYFENDIPTKIYVVPKASATSYMGTAGNPWTNAYITNLNLNGNAFDPISTSGNIGDIVFAYADATGVDLSEKTTSGSQLRLLYIDRGDSIISETSSGLTGTWKFLGLTPGYVTVPGVQIGGVWKRIA